MEDSVMKTSLLVVRVSRKRQIVRAAQLARQIGRLLGVQAWQQAALASGVLETASRAREKLGPIQVVFSLGRKFLEVAFRAENALAPRAHFPPLRMQLAEPLAVAREDLAWMVRELDRTAPVNCFEEMRRQARELLQALAEARGTHVEEATRSPTPGHSAAA
jgi:hypothetical protein